MKKALLLTGGEYHPFESCGKILAEFLGANGTAECTVTDDRQSLADPSGYDVVILYTQGDKLTPDQEAGLCDWVAAGGALVGIHCAADSFVENERYMEMIGSQFTGHGPVTKFPVNITDDKHDVTCRMDKFDITDEFYILKLRTDKKNLKNVMCGKWHWERHPITYVRDYGKGRVLYTGLGHDERAFNHPTFRKLMHRAVMWTTDSIKPGPIRVGLVGYGPSFNMGKLHADTMHGTGAFKVTAVADIDPKRTKAAKKELDDVKVFADHHKLAASGLCDIAIVITPHNCHASIAVDLLKAGVGVISEKPFSITIDQATEMIEAAQAADVMLSVFHNRRWDGDYLTIKRIIEDGLIGEPFQCEAFFGSYDYPGDWWRSHKPISGGAIYDWGAHFTDWILNLMPYKMESVTGFFSKRVWHDVTNEDHCKAIIRFEDNRSADLEMSSIAGRGKPKWRILGTKGGLTQDWEKPVKVTTFINGTREEMEVPLLKDSWSAYYGGIADHLLYGEPLPVTPESARRVIAVLELAEKSSKTGQAEPVPFEA